MAPEVTEGPSGAAPPTPPLRAEMYEAPPFLSWRVIYALVLATLGIQVALYTVLTALYR